MQKKRVGIGGKKRRVRQLGGDTEEEGGEDEGKGGVGGWARKVSQEMEW